MNLLGRFARNLAFRTPLARYLCHKYPYSFSPAQLCFLMQCVDRTLHHSGPIFEIGCFRGATTVWISKHLESRGVAKEYIAIDTFEGFVQEHVAHEVAARGKGHRARVYRSDFTTNAQRLVRETLRYNRARSVRLVRADAAQFDYSAYEGIAFALIDVDLYVPVLAVLERIYSRMAPGGVIVVDDCAPQNVYDGALEAYREFTHARALPLNIVLGKLGVIEVPAGI